jgi:hypothetical protein
MPLTAAAGMATLDPAVRVDNPVVDCPKAVCSQGGEDPRMTGHAVRDALAASQPGPDRW